MAGRPSCLWTIQKPDNVDHSKSVHVRISDPDCILVNKWSKAIRLLSDLGLILLSTKYLSSENFVFFFFWKTKKFMAIFFNVAQDRFLT